MAQYLLKILLSTLIIFLAAKVGLEVSVIYNNISLLWPASGISIAILLLKGKQLWPGIAIGAFLATASTGVGWGFAFGAGVANTVEALFAYSSVQFWQINYQLNRVYDVLRLLLIIMVIAPATASLIGTISFCLSFSCSTELFFTTAWQWWVGNAMGALVVAPLLLTWSGNHEDSFLSTVLSKKGLQVGIGFSLLIITSLIIFGLIETSFLESYGYPLQYLCFPFLIWSGFSLHQRGATAAIFVTVLIAILGIFKETGPFANSDSLHANLFILWSFITVVSIPTLILSSAVTERKLAEDQLSFLAYRDSLTGLPNRAAFFQDVSKWLNHCQISQDKTFCAVLFIDLNRFKEINDSYGHTLGDELLCAVANRLEACIYKEYVISRIGGDEFAVLIPKVKDYQVAIHLSQKIVDQFKLPFIIRNCNFLIGVAIGIVIGNSNYTSSEDLVRDADIAMYHAKTNGRKYCQFEPVMRQRVISRLQLEQDLRWAIQNEELTLVYQPIVNLFDQTITGFETLLRWHNLEQGWISPARFIPVAEDTELIIEIGNWVLIQACSQLQQWEQQFPDQTPITLSVNVSPKQLRNGDLVQHVDQIIQELGINPAHLKLEITETAILEANSKKVLENLKALGVGLYLDDFGVGESSLNRLYQLPLDVIKIDRSFVQGIPENKRKSAIAQTIINLANNMELRVIAEGIETEAQQKELLQWSCEKGQGFLFSKPISASEATEMIRRGDTNL